MVKEEDNKSIITNESYGLMEGNISLVLHSYDALFSDFDPRHYSERGISDDFLIECKRAVIDRKGIAELRLLIPGQLRKPHEENKIKRRLLDHFRKHYHIEHHKIKKMKRKGLLWFFLGSIILVISTFLYEYRPEFNNQLYRFLYDFLTIVSQPSGWFTIWEGLSYILIKPYEINAEYEFYKKMHKSNIYFLNY
ncbi:MAG: hypothetical protein Q8N99_03870 [Nanoarchaeota archaeon]|nr:hypothetical protein [Nanoarchaeota archaeon]